MDMLVFLEGLSPWWWVAFAVALGAVEMLTFTYFLIWLSMAAIGTAVALGVSPSLSGGAQTGIFAALSVIFSIAGRWWQLNRKAAPGIVPGLNRRSERVIGRSGKAIDNFENSEGTIIVDGVRWQARLISGSVAAGQAVTVIDADGMTLLCEPIA